jgi:hypothetical protein
MTVVVENEMKLGIDGNRQIFKGVKYFFWLKKIFLMSFFTINPTIFYIPLHKKIAEYAQRIRVKLETETHRVYVFSAFFSHIVKKGG